MLATADTLWPFLQVRTFAASCHSCWDKQKLKIYFRTGTKIKELFIIKLGTPNHLTDFDAHSGLTALHISESETDAKDKNLENREGEGKAPGQELFVSVAGNKTSIIIPRVIKASSSQRHNIQLQITIIFNHIQS
jgi:hypothetical protein